LRTGYLPYLTRLTFFFYNATATTYIYTLSLHDALPISRPVCGRAGRVRAGNHRHDGARREALMAGLLGGGGGLRGHGELPLNAEDRKSTRLNSSHVSISYAVFCLKKKKETSVRISKVQG